MLLFCRRMCLQLVLLGSNCFLSAACGSSLVVWLKHISAGVLSILQSRPQTIFDKPPCAIFPFLHGTCFFFVGVCVFNSCYWAVIVSFRPPFANRAIHFHLVAIATFWWTTQITFLYASFLSGMCLQLVLLGSNCFLWTSFRKQGYPFSPCCYCDLLVNCTNHFFS